jgi:hypothetical protein
MKTVAYDQPSATPTPKVAAVGVGGAFAVILIWAAQAFGDITIPAEVAASFATIFAFLSGYLKRDTAPVEVVEELKLKQEK